jgi:hypothetical protein
LRWFLATQDAGRHGWFPTIRHYLPASEKKQWLPAATPVPDHFADRARSIQSPDGRQRRSLLQTFQHNGAISRALKAGFGQSKSGAIARWWVRAGTEVPFTKLPEISIFVSEQFWGRAARASRLERVRTPVKFVPTFSLPPIPEFVRTEARKAFNRKSPKNRRKEG